MAASTQTIERRRPGEPGDDTARVTHHIVRATAVAVPLFVVIWVGLIAIAVAIAGTAMTAALGMGAGVGVLAGLFWGAWWGFVRYNREQLDQPEQPRRGAA